MSVFSFSWLLFSLGSEILVRISAESCIMQRALLATCLCHAFFPFLMWFPILRVLSKLHMWNAISQPVWTTCIQLLMPSSGSYPHAAWCIVAVGQLYKGNASCCWTVLQVVSCICVLCSVTVCPMLISALASCTSRRSDAVWAQWRYGCQENLCWLDGEGSE
jgi:hypothetical protein